MKNKGRDHGQQHAACSPHITTTCGLGMAEQFEANYKKHSCQKVTEFKYYFTCGDPEICERCIHVLFLFLLFKHFQHPVRHHESPGNI